MNGEAVDGKHHGRLLPHQLPATGKSITNKHHRPSCRLERLLVHAASY
jgi:hypothetical protein